MIDWAAGLTLTTLLILLARADLRAMILPDALNAAVAATGLIMAWNSGEAAVLEAASGAFLSGALLWLVRAAHYRWRRVEGLGLGDVKLAAAGGLWIGPAGAPVMLLAATASALVFIGSERLRGRPLSAQTAIPFGPFLCLGVAVAWITPRIGVV